MVIASANSHVALEFRPAPLRILDRLKPTAAITDLCQFADFEAYRRAVSRETQGKYPRSANKAARLGYRSRIIAPGSYQKSLYELIVSKPHRSRGRVTLTATPRPDGDHELPIAESPCSLHWRSDWGVFRENDTRMWAYASLIRSGNFLHIAHMLGHADALSRGVTKLLQFDVMRWLLTRQDPMIQDIQYLMHGSIEDGGPGARDWRRYVQQRPHLVELEQRNAGELPSGFDPATYLLLNPDVAAARANPKLHYLRHGQLEGRRYK